ncbi:YtxH domain-containing protein [Candidatus Peregrinibacteria bacterium]|nr:YtxH domain-containing protein [Candidatus Peregrinibacteria bacterium]
MKKPLRFLTSVLAGITLGMLFAPKKGSELRRELSRSSDKLGTFGKELLAASKDASDEVQKFFSRKEVRSLIDSGNAELSDFLKIAKKHGSELSERARTELESLVENIEKRSKPLQKAVKKKIESVRKTIQKHMQ